MSIFLDTNAIEEIREGARWGILSSVTTNPALTSKTSWKSHETGIREIAELVNGGISAETISQDTDGMLVKGRRFADWHPHVVVKAPSTPARWAAVKHLKAEGIRANVTLCFSATQAFFAALAGACIISPFVGRLDGISQDGMQVVRDAVEISRKHQIPTLVSAATIRHLLHIIETAKAGADIATVPFKMLEQAAQHPLTEQGLARFLQDWLHFTTSEP